MRFVPQTIANGVKIARISTHKSTKKVGATLNIGQFQGHCAFDTQRICQKNHCHRFPMHRWLPGASAFNHASTRSLCPLDYGHNVYRLKDDDRVRISADYNGPEPSKNGKAKTASRRGAPGLSH